MQNDQLQPTSKTISNIPGFIETYLRPQLPYSLILARRYQFHEQHKHETPNAEARLFTLNQTTVPQHDNSQPSDLWLAAHIDLTVAGQTQVWLYASWEAQYASHSDPEQAIKDSPLLSHYQSLFNAFFKHVQHQHVPRLEKSPPSQWLRLKAEGKLLSEPFVRSQIVFGTIAQCLWPFLYDYKDGPPNPVGRDDKGYLKYIISRPRESEEIQLPEGLEFRVMDDQHLQTIIDRTVIPRTLETVRQLTNIGIYDGERPIAWGLLGKDGSISSLHAEPEWRGQGLAVAVAERLIQEQSKVFSEIGGTVLTSADVSEKNVASRRVLEKLGGKVMWVVAWVALDLGEL